MSYDIHFYRPVDGPDAYDTYLATLAAEPGPATPEGRAAAARLIQAKPRLECVVEAEGTLTVRARDFGNSNGIQLTFYSDTAALTVPFWHAGDDAQAMLQELWEFVDWMREHAGLAAYDPQIEKGLDLDEDFDEVLQAYLAEAQKHERPG